MKFSSPYVLLGLGLVISGFTGLGFTHSALSSVSQKTAKEVQRLGRQDPDPNRAILPSSFRVYVRGNAVVNSFYPGFEERVLPTVNRFMGYPGCYVAAYSRDPERAAYPIGSDIYVMGQVRVPGRYEGRICRPTNYETADISAAPEFKEMLAEALPDVCPTDTSCWAGGDTGGWFGRAF